MKKYLETIAIFMISLIVNFSIYSAGAFAAINSYSAKGGDGIEGFARQNDFVDFTADASITGDSDLNKQLYLGSGKDAKFEFKCAGSPGGSNSCTLKFPAAGKERFDGVVDYRLNLYKDDGTLDSGASGELVVDKKIPHVRLSMAKNKFSSNEKIIVGYKATDEACNAERCYGLCVGLKSIEFYNLDGSFKQVVDLESEGSCTEEANIELDNTKLKDGMNSIFAKAIDRFAQVSKPVSVTFSVDKTPPAIDAKSFAIIKDDIEISTFSANIIDVNVIVNFTSADLNPAKVSADLSALNPFVEEYKNKFASECFAYKDFKTCRWSIQYNPGSAGAKTIKVFSEDDSGNKGEHTITKALSLDDKVIVKSISTTNVFDGISYGRRNGNTIVALFEEETGLIASNAFLNTGRAAYNCAKKEDWVCTWNNVALEGSNPTLSVSATSTDILGNNVKESPQVQVVVDDVMPVIKDITIESVDGTTAAIPGLHKTGDKLLVKVNVTEQTGLIATADFSKLITGATKVEGKCEKDSSIASLFLCTWNTDKIDMAGTKSIKLNFTDFAGNTLIENVDGIKVFGLDVVGQPDYWQVNGIKCSPQALDRELSTLTEQRSYCQVEIDRKQKSDGNVVPVFVSNPKCEDKQAVLKDDPETIHILGSKKPVIKLTLQKKNLLFDELNFDCDLAIYTKIENTNKITQNPEVENVKINLKLYNNPLGELSEEVEEKIEEAVDDAKELNSLIKGLNNFLTYSKKICQMIAVAFTFAALLYVVTRIVKKSEKKCTESGFGNLGLCQGIYAAGLGSCTSMEGSNEGAEGLMKGAHKFCDYVTCKKLPLWGEDVRRFFNEKIPLLPYRTITPPSGEPEDEQAESQAKPGKIPERDDSLRGFHTSSYMDYNNNLIAGVVFACLPGIITGAEKYRQIRCMYADCLQNGVSKQGLPVSTCDTIKSYETCKYVFGEVWAIIPWTAYYEHFAGLVKNALTNPFTALGLAASIGCSGTCPIPGDGGETHKICRAARLYNLLGEALENVKLISAVFDEKAKQADYCDNVDFGDEDEDDQDDNQQNTQQSQANRQQSQQQNQGENT